METQGFWHLGHVSDERLRSGLKELLVSGYRTEARILAHIAEVEERKLHLRDGSESLFEYCVSRLGLSNSEAFHRITAARIARRFPIVFALIERRDVHLTALCLLRDYLTPENHRELLVAASHKTKWQVQELLATRFPRPDVESRIRKLPTTAAAAPAAAPRPPSHTPATRLHAAFTVAATSTPEPLTGAVALPSVALTPSAPPIPVRGRIEPVSAARYRIQLNASAALKEKLELLQALTSHANASGDLALVIERAVDLALEQAQRKRFAKTERPRKVNARRLLKDMRSLRRGHIPNATKREITARDGLRCAYVGEGGHRCTARSFLQIHHQEPWARGGSDGPNNLKFLCGQHNRLLAEQDFGAAYVAARVATRKSAPRSLTDFALASPGAETQTARNPPNPTFFQTHEALATRPAGAHAHPPPQAKSGRFELTRSDDQGAKPASRSRHRLPHFAQTK